MIIKNPPKLTNKNALVRFIEIDLWSWLRDLTKGTLKINFQENFQGFTVKDVKIPKGVELPIVNQFRTTYAGYVPSGRIIIRQRGDANIIDGPTPWNKDFVYLMNPSANDAVVSVFFYL